MWNAIKNIVGNKNNLSQQRASYEQNGFLVLKNFFSQEELNAFDTDVHNIWQNRQKDGGEITIDVLEGDLVGQRLKLKDAPDSALDCAHKVNDLYLESGACRNLNLNKKLCGMTIGYADFDAVENTLETERADASEFLKLYD